MASKLTGQRVASYSIGDRIERGAFGDVYLGQARDGAQVAIKFMRKDISADEDGRLRFLREIKMMQKVEHPHIVPIIHFGYERGRLYMVMPFIQGASLYDLLGEHRFSPEDVGRLVEQIGGALAAGHAQYIIHRDLKPENILVDTTQAHYRYYLIDFGLAKRPGIDATLTRVGVSVGTPHYTAPEIISARSSQDVDTRADIYSLGVILYELLLGVLPFDSDNIMEIVRAHLYKDPPLPTNLKRDFPPALEKVILHALAKDRATRLANAEGLQAAYRAALGSLTPDERTGVYWLH